MGARGRAATGSSARWWSAIAQPITQPDGRSGRVDILMFRSHRDDNSTERLVIEPKRLAVKVGPKELTQIKNYARVIIDDPQYNGVSCKWLFYLD